MADASDVLQDNHCPNDAVVALGGHNSELVLNHEPSRGDRHSKAAGDFHTEAALGAAGLSTSS